jgi:hypothetical protein
MLKFFKLRGGIVMYLFFNHILLEIIMKRLIAILITFGISLAANAESSKLLYKEGLKGTDKLEIQPIKFRPHGKYLVKNKQYNDSKIKRTSPCENKTTKPKFSKSFRPR